MKKIWIIGLIIIVAILNNKPNNSDFDPRILNEDIETFDDGYFDALNHEKPEYPDDWLYMDGYKAGKEDRD